MRKFDGFLLGFIAFTSINAASASDGFKAELNSLAEESRAQAKEIGYQATKNEDQFQAVQAYANELERRVAKLEEKSNKDKEEMQAIRDQIARIVGVLKKRQSGLRSGIAEALGAIMSQAGKP